MRMQDRLDDVLQPGTLTHDLVAAGDLPAQGLRHLIGDPHLGEETTGVELRQHTSVDRIGFDLGVRDDPHLLGVRDYDPFHMRPDDGGDRGCIAGRFHHDHVVLRQCRCELLQQLAPHADAPQSLEPAIFQSHRLSKGAVAVR
jgi:hypothetical protein